VPASETEAHLRHPEARLVDESAVVQEIAGSQSTVNASHEVHSWIHLVAVAEGAKGRAQNQGASAGVMPCAECVSKGFSYRINLL
jgi:hypothetical protein